MHAAVIIFKEERHIVINYTVKDVCVDMKPAWIQWPKISFSYANSNANPSKLAVVLYPQMFQASVSKLQFGSEMNK